MKLRLLDDPHRVIRPIDVCRRQVNDSPDSRVPRRLDDPLEQARWLAPIAQAVRRRPGFRAVVDDLDGFDRVGERLVVGIRVQLDDRRFYGEGLRDVVAQELPGADDKVQSPRIKARGATGAQIWGDALAFAGDRR